MNTREAAVSGCDASARHPRVPVLGTRVTASTFSEAQEVVAALVEERAGAYISCANAYSLVLAQDNPDYRRILNAAAYVTADGMPVVWALRFLGYPAQRVHNDDLFLACCERFPAWRHFLVGGRTGQPENVASAMRRRFPNITVVGTHATPQRPVPASETEIILEKIRATQPSVIWVGMGTLAQDQWMSAAAPRAGVPMVAVGSLFDLLEGRTKPTPAWMKRSGLQWLFRLSQEPRRLAFRYTYHNLRFVMALSRQLLAHVLHRGRGGESPPPRGNGPAEGAGPPSAESAAQTGVTPGTKDLSVVIVSHNVAHLLGDCLESVFREGTGISVEVFVVDSASTDGTVDLVRERFPQVHLRVSRDNIGFSAGNNAAIPDCRGRYIVLLNPDTIVHDGALRDLIRYLDEHPSVGAASPTLRLKNGEIQPESARNLPTVGNLLPWLLLLDRAEWKLRYRERCRASATQPPRGGVLGRFYLLSWERNQTCEVEYICGACMVVRREVVQQIGLLDEASPLFLDDLDYCRRIRDAGWAIHYVAGPTITHFWEQSTSRMKADLKREGDHYAMVCHAIWLYLRKHDGAAAAAAFSAMACAACVLRVPVCLAALALPGQRWRGFWKRQLHMALGLSRWAFRFRKVPPRFGFASESRVVADAQRRALGGSS